jgi:hypothetical protein
MPSKLPSKVVLGWLPSPLGGMSLLQQGFVDSVFSFLSYDTNPATGRQLFGGYTTAAAGYIPSGRCLLVEAFLNKTTEDWLLMMDWDITFVPEDVYRLLDYADGDPMKVVSGCYLTFFGNDNLLRPCWFAQQNGEEYVPVTEFETDKVIPLTVCGMGFTLMHRKALLKIAEAHKDDPWPWFGHDIIGNSRVGEDLTFCSRARKLGVTVWGHGGVLLGHTKAKTLRAEDMMDTQFARSAKPVEADKPVEPVVLPPSTGEKTVLSIGAGGDLTVPEEYKGWKLHTLDIDPSVKPDIIADGRDLSVIKDSSYDAIYCSHNIEHYPRHDIAKLLIGFKRVLKARGHVNILTPDLGAVMQRVVREGLDIDDTLYVSPSGPITVKDVIYGYGQQIEKSGDPFFEHKGGFTKKSLTKALKDAGFKNIKVTSSNLELKAIGTK